MRRGALCANASNDLKVQPTNRVEPNSSKGDCSEMARPLPLSVDALRLYGPDYPGGVTCSRRVWRSACGPPVHRRTTAMTAQRTARQDALDKIDDAHTKLGMAYNEYETAHGSPYVALGLALASIRDAIAAVRAAIDIRSTDGN